MTTANEATIREFCAAFARRDVDELLTFFTDDAVYHNMPMRPVQGEAAIRGVLEMFLKPAQSVEFAVLTIGSAGDTVFTERLDTFLMGDRRVELPIAGVFDLRGGKIAAWRDYFDLATWTKQASPPAG
ncbi:MAG: nuclear transport factor 2 family protein [Chloroflexota bacterium]|nr:nuclear transport factor 2 family protein [Chloroflexota bacterium]